MRVKKVQTIFLIILIFLPLQYVAVGIIGSYAGEPWPAFVFPGFKNVYESENFFIVQETEFDLYSSSNDKIASLSPHLFFAEIPRSQIGGLTRTLFQNQADIESFSPAAKEFLLKNGTLLTDHKISRLDVIYKENFLRVEHEKVRTDSVYSIRIGTIHSSN